MKILYLTNGQGQDYLRDCVFHGLRSLLGPDVVDVNKLDSMYIGADRSQMYGRGMTLYAELPDITVDRSDIPRKIRDRYYDLVVYGSIHRCHDFLHEVSSMYDPTRVIFIDGEDHPGYLKGLPGVYFKRELHNPQSGVWPIQFAVPKNKILPQAPIKSRLMAPMDPMDKTTYIYSTEEEYYQQYADSYYAPTMMKAGWDCLRHYEILSQWCLPYFRCFDHCPQNIMEKLPRAELNIIRSMVDYSLGCEMHDLLAHVWQDMIGPCMNILTRHLTTEALASRILSTAGVYRKETILCS